jgi:hypothetical protein
MNSFNFNPRAKSLEFKEDLMWVYLTDGRTLGVPLVYFPRLSAASPAQREDFVISGGGIGLHWDELDEDISVKGLLLGIGDKTAQDSDAA